jgi:hypothetical protein
VLRAVELLTEGGAGAHPRGRTTERGSLLRGAFPCSLSGCGLASERGSGLAATGARLAHTACSSHKKACPQFGRLRTPRLGWGANSPGTHVGPSCGLRFGDSHEVGGFRLKRKDCENQGQFSIPPPEGRRRPGVTTHHTTLIKLDLQAA